MLRTRSYDVNLRTVDKVKKFRHGVQGESTILEVFSLSVVLFIIYINFFFKFF